MATWLGRTWRWSCVLVLFAAPALAQGSSASPPLAGTSWQLVRFQGGDGAVVTPDDGAKYTLSFAADGRVAARIDCNRGSGTWKSSGPSQLEFGPLALTRAMCPPESLHDRIVKHWSAIRSYVVKDKHLFLSLMADGGIYEFQPMAPATSPLKPPVTAPAMVLLERGGVTQPTFQVKAASGTRYEGDGVLHWEARGEITLNWMGTEALCKRAAQ